MEVARDGKEVKGAYWLKRTQRKKTVSNNKGKKRGRKSKLLTSTPGQDVNIPLVVGGAFIRSSTMSLITLKTR